MKVGLRRLTLLMHFADQSGVVALIRLLLLLLALLINRQVEVFCGFGRRSP